MKAKIPWLNPRANITIWPGFEYERIPNYPTLDPTGANEYISGLKKNNYTTVLMVNTSYLNAKLTPSIFWMRNWDYRGDYWRYELAYDYSNKWHFTLGALTLSGSKIGDRSAVLPAVSFEGFEHKDQVFFKIAYKWG